MKTRRKWFERAGMIFLVLVCLEAVSGLVFFGNRLLVHFGPGPVVQRLTPDAQPRGAQWREMDHTRRVFVPNQANVRVGDTVCNINALGFRACPSTSTGGVMIACLGDSVTFGWSCSSDEGTYPAQLAKLLPECRIINAGMHRWNSMDVLDLLVTRVVSLKPDCVVILVGWNDIAYQAAPPKRATSRTEPKAGGRTIGQVMVDTFNFCRLVARTRWLLSGGAEAGQGTVLSDAEIIKDAETREGTIDWASFDAYERILRAFVIQARGNSITPVFVTLPHFMDGSLTEEEKTTLLPYLRDWPALGYEDWQRMIEEANARIRKVAREEDVALAECANCVPSTGFADLCHLNDEGSKALAECVADRLSSCIQDRPKRIGHVK